MKTFKKEYTVLYKLAEDKDQETWRSVIGKFYDKTSALANVKSLAGKSNCTITECMIYPSRRLSRGRPRKNTK